MVLISAAVLRGTYSELCILMAVADRDEDAEWGADGESAPPNSFTWSSPWVDDADEGEEEFEGPTMLLDM